MKVVHGPIHLQSYCFNTFEAHQKLTLLSIVKIHPDAAAIFKKLTFVSGLGIYFSELNVLNKDHPDYLQDLTSIAQHCTINYHPYETGTKEQSTNDFVINATTFKAENPSGLLRFSENLKKIAPCTEYFSREDVPAHINIPD